MSADRSLRRERGDGPVRVLCVDDNRDQADLTALYLERENDRLDATTATSARGGLALLREDAFDVVVSDYQMPEMDGVEFLRTVRVDVDEDLPFVIFTGQGREEVAIEALNGGADRYLQKGGDPSSQYGVLARAVVQEAERYWGERALREREENLRVTLESIGDAVVATDTEGRVTRMNAVAEELTGWSSDAAVGTPFADVYEVVDQRTGAPVESPVAKALESGSAVDMTNGRTLVAKDGTEHQVAESAAPIDDRTNGTIGVVVVFRDVSERYARQRRMERQQDALLDLATDEAVVGGDFETAVEVITERVAAVLEVDRASIWLFEDDGEKLRCADLYEAASDDHESGETLTASNYPAYFEALETHRAVDAHDARADPRTRGLADDYLEPLDVASLLDATIRWKGEVVGMLCHEQVGDSREWKDDEIKFAAEAADQVLRAFVDEQ